MGKSARITVTSGPDRGKVFQLNEELVHVGSGGENQIALTDESVSEHQASIVSRDGRYAIYTPLEKAIQIDGNVIPPERWVWLPASAQIKVSKRTALKFDELAAGAAAASPASPAPPAKNNSRKGAAAAREGRPKRTTARRPPAPAGVARFITDKQGDTLVKLGDDGHLPELHLAEGESRKTVETTQKESNPLALYGVLAFSMCASLLMLVADFRPSQVSQEQRGLARQLITRFYGVEEVNLEPYQKLLREARLARSRGDLETERSRYADVLALLNAEDIARMHTGLTGHRGDPNRLPGDDDELLRDFQRGNVPASDQVLRRLISILLRH